MLGGFDGGARAGAQEGRRGDALACRGATHAAVMATALPRLDASIPYEIQIGKPKSEVVRLGISLMKAGLLKEDDDGRPIDTLVVEALSSWIEGVLGHQEVLDLTAVISESPEGSFWDAEGDKLRLLLRRELGVGVDDTCIGVLVGTGSRLDLCVKEPIEALEASAPGLGYELMREVERVGLHLGLMGGWFMKGLAGNLYWAGGTSEEEWVECYGEDLADYSGLRRRELDAAYPYLEKIKGRALSKRALSAYRKHEDARCRKVAEVLWSVRSADAKTKAVIEGESPFLIREVQSECFLSECIEGPVVMGWENLETGYRIGDDAFQRLNDGGEEYGPMPGVAVIAIPVDDPEWFARNEDALRSLGKALTMLDSLLSVLRDGADERG